MYDTFRYQVGTWEPIEDPLTTGWMPEGEVPERVIQDRWASLGYSRVEERLGNPQLDPDVTPVAIRRRTSQSAPYFAVVDIRLCKPHLRIYVADAPSLPSLMREFESWIGLHQGDLYQRGILENLGRMGNVIVRAFQGWSSPAKR